MNFDDYQEATGGTAIYPGKGTMAGLMYTGLGLGEAGEVQGKIKKIHRDFDGQFSIEQAEAIGYELGDLLWYIAACAEELGLKLSDIAQDNLNKLASRAARGTLGGSGDER